MIAAGEDLANLQAFGQPITIAGQAGHGIHSRHTELVLNGEVVWIGETLLTTAALAEGLGYGDSVMIGQATYLLERLPAPSADGALCRLMLSGPIAPPAPVTLELTTTTGLVLTTTTGTHLIRL